MNFLKPLPLFEEFLNEQQDQQAEFIFIRDEQLRGVLITKDTKFNGDKVIIMKKEPSLLESATLLNIVRCD